MVGGHISCCFFWDREICSWNISVNQLVSMNGVQGEISSDGYRALVRDMRKLFFSFLFLFKKAFVCPIPLGRGF